MFLREQQSTYCAPTQSQRGAVLFFCLAMMFIIVLLSVAVSESTNSQQKILALGKDSFLAEENAKRALLRGEVEVVGFGTNQPVPTSTVQQGRVWQINLADYQLVNAIDPVTSENLEWYEQLESWWALYGTEAFAASDAAANGALSDGPRYVIEEYLEDTSNANVGQTGYYYSSPIVVYYRVTARATGDRDGRATYQSVFAKPF